MRSLKEFEKLHNCLLVWLPIWIDICSNYQIGQRDVQFNIFRCCNIFRELSLVRVITCVRRISFRKRINSLQIRDYFTRGGKQYWEKKTWQTGRPGEISQNRESPGGTGRLDKSELLWWEVTLKELMLILFLNLKKSTLQLMFNLMMKRRMPSWYLILEN